MLRLNTLGGLNLESDSGELTGAATQARPLALLALLAVAAHPGLTRDDLMLSLWPDSTPERARNVLKQTLYALRRDLDTPDLVLGVNPIRLNPGEITSDHALLLEALAAGDRERAAALYRGPFLDGFHLKESPEFEQWRSREAERLERLVQGVRPALATTRPRIWRRWLPFAAAAAFAVTFVAERDAAAPSTGAAVDPDLVLVEPFSVYDGRLLLWREGLVDVLARDFDRAGPLRTVTPAVAIRHADETGVASAADLGRRLGAGLVVSGTVLAVGPDSVRLTASLTDLTGTRELGDVDIRGPSNRMGQLTDSLALSLLREMEQVRAITAARAVSLRATSLPALKAFLQGEQFYRHSSFDSAITWYERALGQDSTLALAYYRLANAMGWARPGTEDLQETYSLRAGALTRGLAPADSLLLTAHALFTTGVASYAAAVEPGADPDLARDAPPGPGRQLEERSADAWEAAARLFATLDVAIRRYPGNPDIWYHLGEARVHFGPQFGVPHAAAMSAFDRAIAVDSSFAPAWEHTTDVAPLPDGIAVSRRYAERYLAHHPQTGSASTLEAFLALSAEGVTSDSVARVLARLPADAREGLIFLYKRSPDTTEIAVRLARSALAQDPAATHPATHRLGVRILSYRGHLREALENSRPPDARLLSLTARLHLTPADSAAARFSAWLDRGASEAAYGLPWWAEVGDTAALETFARRENARALKATRPRTSDVHRYWAAVGLGYLALATGDSAEALRRFGGLPRDICPACLEERLILARLLSAAERPREAAAILGERPLWIDLAPAPVEVFWELEEGRVAERLGERERAARCYRFVTEAWRHADPELQSSVRESQAALGRLAQPSPG